MIYRLNETHDVRLRSWVESANAHGTDFPIQNLPYGVFRRRGSIEDFRIGVAIGAQILDLRKAYAAGVFDDADNLTLAAIEACRSATLNALMALGSEAWQALRLALSRLLRDTSPAQVHLRQALLPQDEAEYTLPMTIGDYTDFYTSIHHATAVGKLFRPDAPLLPNYKWVPIGYHGRVSSIGVSGQQFRRPLGQTKSPERETPVWGPSKRLDFELEVGIVIGTGNALGEPVSIDDAESRIFGLCLLNDWSARDVQAWEYQPLGPFLAKNFATTVSPWIVTLDALTPYRVPFERPESDPAPLPYLDSPSVRSAGSIDVDLEVLIETARMQAENHGPERLARSNFRHSYWTAGQLVTHHTAGGCNLREGDLLGSGTQSGPQPNEAGSLLELTSGGRKPIVLANGEQRVFIEDGDTIVLRAWAEKAGFARIGFGEARGTVLAATHDASTSSTASAAAESKT
ncbi:fumarylacetoacetase [Pararobbsia silviterrae]|uniref:fumarylacetoacetase n=1 Tax=Pararobbsia silviterrae TaxID=1792498 RepID=A0A494Y0E6_9BURK|nr:fumarylacetoacetase [Pararobbsia silviterrae]RKP55719.1 fumarylacetoacetase [Pararobbsia silviterrae]